jgi:hypothetical protein
MINADFKFEGISQRMKLSKDLNKREGLVSTYEVREGQEPILLKTEKDMKLAKITIKSGKMVHEN